MVTFVAATTAASASASSITVSVPAGTQQGDVMLASVTTWDVNPTITTPAGWTLVQNTLTPSLGSRQAVFWRVAGASEPASYTITRGGTGGSRGTTAIMASYRGAIAAIDASAAASGNANSGTAPSVTTTAAGQVLAFFGITRSTTISTPAGTTSRANLQSGTAFASVRLVDAAQAGSGASPAWTATFGTSGDWIGTTVALKSANSAPNAPTPTSPANNASVDRSQAITLAATFSDPDPGDSPSASQWRYRVVGAGTWTTVTQNNPLQSYSIPAGLAAGQYEWQAAYADQAGVWGPFCGSAFFTAADPPPGPTWLDPTSGQTIGTSSYTGVISTPSLDKSQWTLYADNAGAISSTVLQGPVTVATGDLRSHTFTGLANNTPVWWSVRTSSGGLWSQPVQIRTPVSYTSPAAPTVTLTPGVSSLVVGITNPAPGAGEPTVSYNDVYVDDGQGLGWERVATMLEPSTAWTYYLPVSGRDYSGAVKVTAVAANGTSADTIA